MPRRGGRRGRGRGHGGSTATRHGGSRRVTHKNTLTLGQLQAEIARIESESLIEPSKPTPSQHGHTHDRHGVHHRGGGRGGGGRGGGGRSRGGGGGRGRGGGGRSRGGGGRRRRVTHKNSLTLGQLQAEIARIESESFDEPCKPTPSHRGGRGRGGGRGGGRGRGCSRGRGRGRGRGGRDSGHGGGRNRSRNRSRNRDRSHGRGGDHGCRGLGQTNTRKFHTRSSTTTKPSESALSRTSWPPLPKNESNRYTQTVSESDGKIRPDSGHVDYKSGWKRVSGHWIKIKTRLADFSQVPDLLCPFDLFECASLGYAQELSHEKSMSLKNQGFRTVETMTIESWKVTIPCALVQIKRGTTTMNIFSISGTANAGHRVLDLMMWLRNGRSKDPLERIATAIHPLAGYGIRFAKRNVLDIDCVPETEAFALEDEPELHQKLVAKLKYVHDKYGMIHVLAGHSLGGKLAQVCTQYTHTPAVIFNSFLNIESDRVVSYRAKGDVAAMGELEFAAVMKQSHTDHWLDVTTPTLWNHGRPFLMQNTSLSQTSWTHADKNKIHSSTGDLNHAAIDKCETYDIPFHHKFIP
jgi:hypothetical protein